MRWNEFGSCIHLYPWSTGYQNKLNIYTSLENIGCMWPSIRYQFYWNQPYWHSRVHEGDEKSSIILTLLLQTKNRWSLILIWHYYKTLSYECTWLRLLLEALLSIDVPQWMIKTLKQQEQSADDSSGSLDVLDVAHQT